MTIYLEHNVFQQILLNAIKKNIYIDIDNKESTILAETTIYKQQQRLES